MRLLPILSFLCICMCLPANSTGQVVPDRHDGKDGLFVPADRADALRAALTCFSSETCPAAAPARRDTLYLAPVVIRQKSSWERTVLVAAAGVAAGLLLHEVLDREDATVITEQVFVPLPAAPGGTTTIITSECHGRCGDNNHNHNRGRK